MFNFSPSAIYFYSIGLTIISIALTSCTKEIRVRTQRIQKISNNTNFNIILTIQESDLSSNSQYTSCDGSQKHFELLKKQDRKIDAQSEITVNAEEYCHKKWSGGKDQNETRLINLEFLEVSHKDAIKICMDEGPPLGHSYQGNDPKGTYKIVPVDEPCELTILSSNLPSEPEEIKNTSNFEPDLPLPNSNGALGSDSLPEEIPASEPKKIVKVLGGAHLTFLFDNLLAPPYENIIAQLFMLTNHTSGDCKDSGMKFDKVAQICLKPITGAHTCKIRTGIIECHLTNVEKGSRLQIGLMFLANSPSQMCGDQLAQVTREIHQINATETTINIDMTKLKSEILSPTEKMACPSNK